MAPIYTSLALLSTLGLASAEIYFKEQFNDASWRDHWVESTSWKAASDMGKWGWTAGEWYGDASDKGLQTTQDARFYGISAELSKPFNNAGKDLVFQFSVKNEQKLDCGGAYVKLLGPDVDQAKFGGDTPYSIMFGPDICGTSTRKTHVIFNYPPKKDNLLIKKDVRTETDQLSHLYTLWVRTDNTFEVFIDDKSARSGKLEEEFDFLLPREIPDPALKKPADWVDDRKIADPTDVKPAGWDDISKEMPDPEAKKPEDWDDDEDGEWEAPTIPNPEFKGTWKPRMIDNPAYKGEWVHPKIDNPAFVEDDNLYHRCSPCTHVGLELWQVTSGSIFDDILVTDSIEEARAFGQSTFFAKQADEKAMFEAKEEAKREQERREREEREKKEESEDVHESESDSESNRDEL